MIPGLGQGNSIKGGDALSGTGQMEVKTTSGAVTFNNSKGLGANLDWKVAAALAAVLLGFGVVILSLKK